MNFNNLFFVFIVACIVSCSKEDAVVFTECVDCIESASPNMVDNDTSVVLTLEEGYYCIGDSGWLMPNGIEYWTEIDSSLIILMVENGNCYFLGDPQ